MSWHEVEVVFGLGAVGLAAILCGFLVVGVLREEARSRRERVALQDDAVGLRLASWESAKAKLTAEEAQREPFEDWDARLREHTKGRAP